MTKPIRQKGGKTSFYQHHQPISVAYKVLSRVKGFMEDSTVQIHTGEDCVAWFLAQLTVEEEKILKKLNEYQEMVLSERDKENFEKARQCYICHNDFSENDAKVRDHDHLTAAFRGAAHNSCNLKLQKQFKIPVFFHNFRGYDSHLLVWGFANDKKSRLSVIGQGLEKYLLIQWGDHYEFKDSLQFLPASLERLVESLKSCEVDKFIQLRRGFPLVDERQMQFQKQKGIYPYDWMDSIEKMNDRLLPPQDSFNSVLRNEACSDADYNRALDVWVAFNFQTFLEYHEHYLACM